MPDYNAWRRRVSGWLTVAMMAAIYGCAGPQVGAKLDPKLLPAFPDYSVQPMEIPCGTERCLVIRKDDLVYLVKWMKAACFTLTGDGAYCQMEPTPMSEHHGSIIPTRYTP